MIRLAPIGLAGAAAAILLLQPAAVLAGERRAVRGAEDAVSAQEAELLLLRELSSEYLRPQAIAGNLMLQQQLHVPGWAALPVTASIAVPEDDTSSRVLDLWLSVLPRPEASELLSVPGRISSVMFSLPTVGERVLMTPLRRLRAALSRAALQPRRRPVLTAPRVAAGPDASDRTPSRATGGPSAPQPCGASCTHRCDASARSRGVRAHGAWRWNELWVRWLQGRGPPAGVNKSS